jgi:putative membrane protein
VSPAAQALAAWHMPLDVVIASIVTGIIYIRGFIALHAQMPNRFPRWRLAAFSGGLAAILIAVASPLAAFDDLLLQVHMIQHMILMLVAPPLLLLGAPTIPLLRGLPAALAKAVGQLLGSPALRRLGRFITHPIVAWIVLAATTWGWHVPGPYQLALRSERWHAVEHTCFISASLLFWWPVIQPWPSVAQWPRWTMIPYLLLADVQNTILSAILAFSDRLIYPFYATAPRLGGITPLDDQITAGVIMWVPGSLFFLIPAAAIIFSLLAPENLARPDRKDARVASRLRPARSKAG